MQREKEKVNNFVGIDISKKELEVIRITNPSRFDRFRSGTDGEGLKRLLLWLQQEDIVVMEAGSQAFRIAKRIKERGIEVIVLNPGDVATIYNSLKKTDKEDALKLARLAQRHPREELPEVEVPSDEEEDARRLTTEQGFWSKQAAKGKNRLHSLFIQAGITNIKKKDLNNDKNRKEAVKLLPARYQKEADRLILLLATVEENLKWIQEETREILQENIGYTQIAMSIPGIGPITTLALYAYLGNCKRFSAGKQASYYVGMVPRVDQSGDTVIYGNIIKRGCTPIRRVIIQGAWSLVRSEQGGELKKFYDRLSKRIGKKKAIVAVGRKMIETFHAMIKSGELYRGISDDYLENKLMLYGLVA